MTLPAIQIAPPERNGRVVNSAEQRMRCQTCGRLEHRDRRCPLLMDIPALRQTWERVVDPICRNPACPCPAHALAELALLNVYADGWQSWRLSETEAGLLAALLPLWRDVSHFELLCRVWGAAAIVSERGTGERHLLRVNIARLRRKLGPSLKIVTLAGIGYRLVPMSVPEP